MNFSRLAGKVELHRGQSYKSALLDLPGPVLLGLGTIGRNGGFKGGDLRTYGGDSPARILVRPGDLYLSLKDVTHKAELLGAVARVPATIPIGRLTQDTVRLQITSADLDPDYLYWLLQTPQYRAYCKAHGTGTTNLDLGRSDFLDFAFRLPSMPEQQAIAQVLGALDAKIAANAALAATADQLMRTEYIGLSEASRVRVGDVAISPRDSVEPREVDSSTAYVGLEHIPRRMMWLDDVGTAANVTSGKSRFEAGDILFGKLRPYFHKVVSAPGGGICSTDILVVRTKDPAVATTFLAAVSSDEVVTSVVAGSEGTRMPRTSWRDLAGVEIKWPTAGQATMFDARLSSIRSSVLEVLAESRALVATRDALLPAFMSGDIHVRDVEDVAADAGV